METWKPVVGFANYLVSDLGRVRSLGHRVRCGPHYRDVPGKVLKPHPKKHGYLEVAMPGHQMRLVHRLVLEAFVGPCPAGMECLHGDDDRTNCRLDNLRWGTHKENGADMRERGRAAKGSRHGRAALTAELEAWVRESSQGPYVVADILGVTQKVIYRARAGC